MVDFDVLEEACFLYLDSFLSEFDDELLSDVFKFLKWGKDRYRRERDERLQYTLMICTAVRNWGGMRGKGFIYTGLMYLYNMMTRKTTITPEELDEKFERAKRRGRERKLRERRAKYNA